MKKIRHVALLTFMLLGTYLSYAQVNINETFDGTTTPVAGFTYDRFARTTSIPCTGAASIRVNNYSGTGTQTANIQSPAFTSNGASATISFSYKVTNWSAGTVATPNTFGTITTECSLDGGTTYNVATGLINSTNHVVSASCASVSYTVSAGVLTSGNSIKVRIKTDWSAGDYYVYIDNLIISQLGTLPPNCASVPLPANMATAVPLNPTLSWTAPTGGATSYDVYLGTSSTPPLVGNSTTTSYTTALLNANTLYYWQVVPKNANGAATGCTIYSFTTGTSVQYCIPTPGTLNGVDIVTNVTSGTLNNTSTVNAVNSYSNYSDSLPALPIPNFAQSTNQPLSIKFGTDGTQHSAVWIDFNNNGNFETSENVALSTTGAAGSATVTYNLIIPASATLGNTKMRVRGGADVAYTAAGACATSAFGETEDYTINISAPPSCLAPISVTAATVTTTTSTLNWVAPSTAPSNGYAYFVNTTGVAPNASTVATGTVAAGVLTASFTALTPNTTYYYWVKSDCGGTFSTWTGSNAIFTGYCTAVPTSVDGTGITAVVFSSVNNTATGSSTITYRDFSSQIGSAGQNATMPISITLATSYNYRVRVFIDFNNDLDFNDPGENTNIGISTSANPTTITGNIVIPAAATIGNKRLRIVATYDDAVNDPCYSLDYGVVHDYTLNVTVPPTCFTPTALTNTLITGNAASHSWTAPTTAPSNGYEWAVTTTSTSPVSGTATMGLTANSTGLLPGTTYYLHVRSVCGSSFSTWTSVIFNTVLANDNCANATPLTIGVGSCQTPLLGTLSLANNTTGLADPDCISSIYAADVWYSVTVQPGKTINVEMYAVKASGNDLGLQAYTGDCSALPGSLITKLCNDDGNPLLGPSALMPSMVLSNTGIIDSVYLLRVVPYSTIANASAFSICAWENFAVTPPVATTTNCVNVAINFDSARKYMDVPVFDAGGNIIATIYPNGNIMGNTIVSYNVNTGTVRRDDLGVYVLDRNITITPTTQPSTTLPVQVRAYIKGTEVLTLDAADPAAVTTASLVVSKYNTNVCTNMLPPSIATLITPTSSTYGASDAFVQFNTNSFSTFYFHGGLVPLANSSVEAFTATKLGNTALVNWKVAAINNTVSYQVMKSTDGRNFISIANVTAVASQRSYNSTDANLANGANYYKLKATDRNGVVSFSNVAVVYNNTKGFEIVSLIPTLVNGSALASIGSNVAQNATLVVTDMQGKIVYKKQIGLQAGTTDVMVDATKFAIGTYVLHAVIANGNSNKVRFIKQ